MFPFKVGVFNAQSVSNKSAGISDWIMSNKLSIVAVTETWHDGHDSPGLIACCPSDFSNIETARPRNEEQLTTMGTNHGGVCLFHHCSIKVDRLHLAEYSSFEIVCARISRAKLSALVAVVYRPG